MHDLRGIWRIADLAALSKLKKLWINGTSVSEAGAARLQRQLPKCEIIYGRAN